MAFPQHQPDQDRPPDAGGEANEGPPGLPHPAPTAGPPATDSTGSPFTPAAPFDESATAFNLPPTPVVVPGRPRRRLPVVGIAMGLVFLLGGSALFMAGYSFGSRRADTPGTPVTDDEAFQPFWDAYHAIINRYAGGDVDRQKLIEGAIRGMINALEDPYSSYLTPEEYRESLQSVSGEFEGIGAEIATQDNDGAECGTLSPNCRLVVVTPLDGSPAQKAGLLAGDVITAVDGSSVDGLTADEARDRIRGQKGTDVTLSLIREGGTVEDMTITRDVIVQNEVSERDLADGEVGYLRLAGFSERGADELTAEIEEDVEAGRTKLILDLRRNPGGFVTAARTVASQFIASGPIFWQEDAKGNQEATTALGDGAATDPSIELVVLIDRGSASASEIVAGALKDTDRATVVGETSYGKGTVQTWEQLAGGNGAMRLTIARWLTPDKHWIHEVGVEPDVAVDVPANLPAGSDPILDRAVELLTDEADLPASRVDRAA